MRACAIVALPAALAALAGCGSRESHIEQYSLSFMTKDPSLEARRAREADGLAKLGAFYEGMTSDAMKQVLGAPTFVWQAGSPGAGDLAGHEMQFVYRLDGSTSLRAYFSDGGLRRLRRQLEIRTVDGDSGVDVPLAARPR